MFERFSDGARQTVVMAQEEARRLSHNHIGTEHLLLGLLREGDSVAARALGRLGIVLADVRADVVRIIGEGSETPSGHIPFTPRSKKVLELSLREALELGSNHIGTEHILLGLVREGHGVATQVLVDRGADLRRVRATLLTLVRHGGSPPATGAAERTPGGEEALSNARQLAGGGAVGTHHLLEALARSEDSLAGKVLVALGVDAEALAAKIDEIGVDGTSDITPAEAAARQMELRIEGGVAHVVLGDEASVHLVRTLIESFRGTVRGGDVAVGSLAPLWSAIVGSLEELCERMAPVADESEAARLRSTIVGRAIQSRLARRRAR
jgi:ATP-dependent Clp protease ATP-binding subunit ClpC